MGIDSPEGYPVNSWAPIAWRPNQSMSRKAKRDARTAKPATAASPPETTVPAPVAPAEAPWPSATILNIVRALLLVALGVSAYLAWTSLTRGSVIGCGPESDCDRVLQSRWARWFGIPVSVFAVAVDLMTLWGTFALGPAASASARRRGWAAVTFGAMLILGAGIWFVALQFVAVGICPYCMTAHGAGVVAALLLLFYAARPEGAGQALFRSAGYAASVALAVLFVGQVVHAPKTGRETRNFAVGSNAQSLLASQAQAAVRTTTNLALASTGPLSNSTSNIAAPMPATNIPMASTSNVPPAPATNFVPLQVFTPGMKPVEAMRRPFKTYGGMIALDLAEVPLIGSETNAHAIVSLFDYTCHHCRLMHPVLKEVQEAFKDRLSIISLPMPLDPKCNQTVTRTSPDHSNACAYAHLALATFRANRAKHREFDEWLFTGERPPPMGLAVARAAELVGTNALAQVLRDPWIAEQIRFDVAVYEIAYRQGRGRMPQFIIGNAVAEGAFLREELLKMLDEHLGLKQTP